MKKRGSAIVIAIFLVAAIGGLAFSFGKVFLLEAANANLVESGISAYYAAESGVEEGFLRYRYDRNAEIPFSQWTLGEDSVFRSNLTDSQVFNDGNMGVSKTNTPIANNNKQIYYLRQGYIGTFGEPFYGQDASNNGYLDDDDFQVSSPAYGSGEYSFLRIKKDETYKIKLDGLRLDSANLGNNDLELFAKFINPSANPRGNSIMYVKLTVDEGLGGIKEYRTMITSDNSGSNSSTATCGLLGRRANCYLEKDILIANLINNTPAGTTAWHQPNLLYSLLTTQLNASIPTSSAKITLFLRPLYYDAYIGLSTKSCVAGSCGSLKTSVVPGPYTNISSTGYFGQTAKTIEANIDRQSGSLYDLFDYVIYKNQ